MGIIRERAPFLELILVVEVLQREALHGLAVRDGGFPVGRENRIDGVNDAILADDVGGIRRPAGVIVELPDQRLIHVQFAELGLAREGVATESLEGPDQLVGIKVLGDDVRLDHLLAHDAVPVLDRRIGGDKYRERTVPSQELGAFGLVDAVLEEVCSRLRNDYV